MSVCFFTRVPGDQYQNGAEEQHTQQDEQDGVHGLAGELGYQPPHGEHGHREQDAEDEQQQSPEQAVHPYSHPRKRSQRLRGGSGSSCRVDTTASTGVMST